MRRRPVAAALALALAGAACESSTAPDHSPSSIPSDWSAPVADHRPATTPALPRPDDAPPSSEAATPVTPLPVVRFDLPLGVEGFAGEAGLTGGVGGELYLVDSAADSGPGTYREALSEGDRIVRFDASLDGQTIALDGPVETHASNLTIDASGMDITVSGDATRFSGTNIVVAGMTYSGNDANDETDAVTFREPDGTQVFGLFGNTFEHAADGLVDIIWNDGHDVHATICDNAFQHHDKAMLIDSGNEDQEGGLYSITLCRNHWLDVYQRMPLSRFAHVHTYNSVFERYGKPDGSGGGVKAGGDGDGVSQHLLEGNMAFPRREGEETFDGERVRSPRAEFAAPQLDSDGAVAVSGSFLATVDGLTAVEQDHDPGEVFTPPYRAHVAPAGQALAGVVAATAGSCLARGRSDAVDPCAPLILDEEDGRLEVAITWPDTGRGDPSLVQEVTFRAGSAHLKGERIDATRWSVDIGGLGVAPTPVWAIVHTTDGRSAASDLVLVSNVS
jgi:pectate lyase